MTIKALKNLSKDEMYFGLNTEDIINVALFIFLLRLTIVNVNHTYILIVTSILLTSFLSYIRLNFRRKIIRDTIAFYYFYLVHYKVRV
jgi:hypothetical protein